MVIFNDILGFLLYNTYKDLNQSKNSLLEEKNSQQANNTLIDINKNANVKSIPGLHKHEKRTL